MEILLSDYNKDMSAEVIFAMITNPIKLNNVNINFTVTADYVGILRSSAGNETTIDYRIKEHMGSQYCSLVLLHW